MKKIFSILLALALAVFLMFGACVTEDGGELPVDEWVEWIPDVHGQVSFMQLEWMASPEEALYPYSNVGTVEFTFLAEAGDWLLDEQGGGWLNVVIDTTAAGGGPQWAVQNLYLTYYDVDYLLGSTPSVQFSLGLDGETPIEELEAAVFLSSEPLEEQPEAEELSNYPVSPMPYLVGGVDGGGSATWDTPLIIGAFNGSSARVGRNESISIPVKNVPKINVGDKGCIPAAAARSISYLGKVHNFTTDNPQDMYNDLVVEMKTQIGGKGTVLGNITPGKDSYCAKKGLNITSEFVLKTPYMGTGYKNMSWKDLTKKVMDAIKNKCDVEIYFASLKWIGTKYILTSGHMAMVTFVANHTDGSATIRYVDDPTQGNNKSENKEWTISVDNAGMFKDGTYRRVVAFLIECYVPPEEEEEEEEEEWTPWYEPWVAYVHGEVSFMQLERMASPGEALYPLGNQK